MAMYVPLFAAVNAQYQKAQNVDHPRILALDEAFAGVDDKNIESIFQLMQKMGFEFSNSLGLLQIGEKFKYFRTVSARKFRDGDCDFLSLERMREAFRGTVIQIRTGEKTMEFVLK